jgi:predicted nucleic acid-binding protein
MPLIYLDTCIVIGLIEGDASQQALLKNELLSHQICSTELTRLEARLLAVRQKNEIALKQFDRFFMICQMIDLDRAVFELATNLRSKSQLKTPDALHLAAAIESRCDEFWTNDKQLAKAAGEHVKIVDWEVLYERSTGKRLV